VTRSRSQTLRGSARIDGSATAAERRQLEPLKVSLDQCWDLLRGRRALRAAALDAEAARVRDESVVEGYEQ